VRADQHALADAIVRAQAYIGDRAPLEFQRNLSAVSAFVIQPGSVYRMCVPGRDSGRTYCVVVRVRLPFGSGVTFAGYEPNAAFAEGVN